MTNRARPSHEVIDSMGYVSFSGAQPQPQPQPPKSQPQPAKASAEPAQPAQAAQPAPQPIAETLDLDTVIEELWARDPATRRDFVSLRSCQAFYRRTADERAEAIRRAQPPQVRLIYPEGPMAAMQCASPLSGS